MAEEWKIQPASADLQLHLQLTERVKKLEDQMGWIIARTMQRQVITQKYRNLKYRLTVCENRCLI